MRRCALVLLGIVVAGGSGTTQSSTWPPILLARPSDAAAPAATATVIPARGLTVNAVAVDALDNVYVAGTGTARDVPGFDRGFDSSPDGGDAFVAKVDRSGAVAWATYVGGTDRFLPAGRVSFPAPDSATAIAVDASGQVYIAGVTSANNFPVIGGFQTSRLGDTDGFVAKLSADGRRIIYSSYVGATGESMAAHGIAVGPAGEAWVQLRSPLRRWTATRDLSGGVGQIVVLRLNPSGAPVWSTRVGLSEEGGFAVDGAGRAYLSGPSLCGFRGCDQVMLRLDPSGSLQYSASFPNRYADVYRSGVALLPNGRAAFSGVTADGAPLPNDLPPCASFCAQPFLAIVNDAGAFETVNHLDIGGTTLVLAADASGRITVATGLFGGANAAVARPLIDHHVDGPIYVSRDRGTTFAVEGRPTLPQAGIADLVFNWARNGLYAVANGIFESNDDATAWRLDTQRFDGMYRIAVDRRQPSIRYAIFDDHVFRHDAGQPEWRIVFQSPRATHRRTVVVSPHDSSVWIAGNTGVAMSPDGGARWIDRSAGLPNLGASSPTVVNLVFDPQQAGVVYALTRAGLYRTSDNGVTWGQLLADVSVAAIAFDPMTQDTIHAAALNFGVWTSRDDGRSWTRTLEGHRVTVVATDQMKRHIVYAAGLDPEGRTVFHRSIDRGATWHRAGDGLHMRAEPSRLIVDPRDSLKLYLGSSALNVVPYVMRLQPGPGAGRYSVEFASYLGHGEVRSLASTLSGGFVAALTHAWPSASLNDTQIAIVRVAP